MPINISISINLNANGYEFVLPLENFSGTISWGDTNTSLLTNTTNPSHTYINSGSYVISLSDTTSLSKYGDINTTIKPYVTSFSYSIKINNLTNLANAFSGYINLTEVNFNTNVTDNVTDMSGMFYNCSTLNCPIELNCTSCTTLYGLFQEATAFNNPLTLTNTNNVTDMSYMFYQAFSFNQPLNLDCTSCTTLYGFLQNAGSFNNSLNLTPIPVLSNAELMLSGPPLSSEYYSNLLNLWDNQTLIRPNVTLDAYNINYNQSSLSARNSLITNYNWTINDGGYVQQPPPDIISVSPSIFILSGGATTITGTDLKSNTIVKLDESIISIDTITSTTITCTLPEKPVGNYMLKVETDGGSDTFFPISYNLPPTITNITPSTGTQGTVVIISGSNFISNISVTMEDNQITFTLDSASQISITMPEMPNNIPGPYQIRISNGYGSDTTTFTYESDRFISNAQELQDFLMSQDIYGIIDNNIILTENMLNNLDFCKYLSTNNNNYKIYKMS